MQRTPGKMTGGKSPVGAKDACGKGSAVTARVPRRTDPFGEDRLGNLKLTKTGLAERNAIVFGETKKSGTPIVVTLGGGYPVSIDDIVDIHTLTLTLMCRIMVTLHPLHRRSQFEQDRFVCYHYCMGYAVTIVWRLTGGNCLAIGLEDGRVAAREFSPAF